MLRNIGYSGVMGGQTTLDSGSARLGSCMALELFRTSDSFLFVLAGYESGTVALWEIKQQENHTCRILWQTKEHTEPGNKDYSTS